MWAWPLNLAMLPISLTTKMRPQRVLFSALALVGMVAALGISAPASTSTDPGLAPEIIAQIAARVIAEAIPHTYERSQDWGRTRKITTGLRSSGNFFKFDIHSRKKEVNDGVWKKYRVTLIEPDKNLDVCIENLQKLDAGRYSLTLSVTAKLHGWARARVYESGVHIISLEAEGDTSVRLRIDAEIAFETVVSKSFVPGIAIRPVVTGAKLKLDHFELNRLSDVRGPIVHELGDGLRHVIEDKLSGAELVAKINHSIEKRRNRLELSPDRLLGISKSDRKLTAVK